MRKNHKLFRYDTKNYGRWYINRFGGRGEGVIMTQEKYVVFIMFNHDTAVRCQKLSFKRYYPFNISCNFVNFVLVTLLTLFL